MRIFGHRKYIATRRILPRRSAVYIANWRNVLLTLNVSKWYYSPSTRITIISDSWTAYNSISEICFTHRTDNHRFTFDDPKTRARTQIVERTKIRKWTPVKVKKLSQSHIATDGQSISKSWRRAPSGAHDQIFITLWQLRSCFCGAPSVTRGPLTWLLYSNLRRTGFNDHNPFEEIFEDVAILWPLEYIFSYIVSFLSEISF
jgi:hypothetical protein